MMRQARAANTRGRGAIKGEQGSTRCSDNWQVEKCAKYTIWV